MSGYKVEICGVNTSRLPLLTNEEKDALFQRILAGDRQAREDYISFARDQAAQNFSKI